MAFHEDSSREYVQVDGKWVQRHYTKNRINWNKKKKEKVDKVGGKQARKQKKKHLIRQVKKDSQQTTNCRKNSKLSPGEKVIADFLVANRVHFFREHYFPNLYNQKTKRLLYFDFYLPHYNLVIEYDGLHHFKSVYGDKKLQDQRYRDKQKWGYCKRHKIHFLRIKCFDHKEIENIICKKLDEIAPVV